MKRPVIRVLISVLGVLGTLVCCGTLAFYLLVQSNSTFGFYSLNKACSHQGRGWDDGEFQPENLLHAVRHLSAIPIRCFDLDVVKDAQGFRVGHPSAARAVALRGNQLPTLTAVLALFEDLSGEAAGGVWRVTLEPKAMNQSDIEQLHRIVDSYGHEALSLRVMEDTAVIGQLEETQRNFAALILRDRDLHWRETTETWCRMQGPISMMSPTSDRLFDVWVVSWKLWRECAGPQRERTPVLARPRVHVWGMDSLEEECAALADDDVDMVISNDPLRLIQAQRRGWCIVSSLTSAV